MSDYILLSEAKEVLQSEFHQCHDPSLSLAQCLCIQLCNLLLPLDDDGVPFSVKECITSVEQILQEPLGDPVAVLLIANTCHAYVSVESNLKTPVISSRVLKTALNKSEHVDTGNLYVFHSAKSNKKISLYSIKLNKCKVNHSWSTSEEEEGPCVNSNLVTGNPRHSRCSLSSYGADNKESYPYLTDYCAVAMDTQYHIPPPLVPVGRPNPLMSSWCINYSPPTHYSTTSTISPGDDCEG